MRDVSLEIEMATRGAMTLESAEHDDRVAIFYTINLPCSAIGEMSGEIWLAVSEDQ